MAVLAAELGDPKLDHTIFVRPQSIPLQQRINYRRGTAIFTQSLLVREGDHIV
jgi:hypothetical protein